MNVKCNNKYDKPINKNKKRIVQIDKIELTHKSTKLCT